MWKIASIEDFLTDDEKQYVEVGMKDLGFPPPDSWDLLQKKINVINHQQDMTLEDQIAAYQSFYDNNRVFSSYMSLLLEAILYSRAQAHDDRYLFEFHSYFDKLTKKNTPPPKKE